jgi:hypothetical protein
LKDSKKPGLGRAFSLWHPAFPGTRMSASTRLLEDLEFKGKSGRFKRRSFKVHFYASSCKSLLTRCVRNLSKLVLANGELNISIKCKVLIVKDFIFTVMEFSGVEMLFRQLAPSSWIANITLAYRMYAG